tara:strand:+ start:1842 stop:2093 length:252 start_codon:yes stop_codon:yes gene_type:complete
MGTYAVFDSREEAEEQSAYLSGKTSRQGCIMYSEVFELNDGRFGFPLTPHFPLLDVSEYTEEYAEEIDESLIPEPGTPEDTDG